MSFIAHKEDSREQTIWEHVMGTAEYAETFAEIFGAGKFARSIALFHDIGKYSEKFQSRIRGAKIQVDHSTAGAKYLYKSNQNILGKIAAYCISGHHGGLPDGGSPSQPREGELYARLQKELDDHSALISDFKGIESALTEPHVTVKNGFQASFLTRMVYSCLVDADWLDTEHFMSGDLPRGEFENVCNLWRLYQKKLKRFEQPTGELNILRTEILNNCLTSAEGTSGLFTLTAPTGSGKTISSMAFALKHAVKQNKRRVIFVVPFNTIIEQNAEVFEKMLGSENVLQHHSGIAYSNDEQSPDYRKLLATENWDAPVIVTSSVRFFESLFANKPSDCRKLHNITGSVVVFDEAQMIPLPYLIPCVEAIKELVMNYCCSVVLATATQSSLNTYLHPLVPKEIIQKPKEMYEAFKRVSYDCSLGKLTDDDLVDLLTRHDQVLCIVNTRKRAQVLANKIDGALHLSTTMYPLHRSDVLTEIRRKLEQDKPCIVISTSLIEAGVDIDFPVVYREKAGLDSIVQAAGRCNRENKRSRDKSIVYVFEGEDRPHGSAAQNISAYEHAARQISDISSIEAIKLYFEQLRYIIGQENLDRKTVVQAFNDGAREGFSLPFECVAKSFHLIEENTKTIYVLIRAPELDVRLRAGERSRELFRELQKYTVSLRRSDLFKLDHQFEHLDDEILLLTIRDLYNKKIGIELSSEGGVGLFC